ncbi:abortive infection system antitoxin AbiGi family protein [Chelativorans sp. YIM 93263]|uniref:abortive infection system antitoxin AbiGi family protein n=1 Tax=Chelativorans sp. YIM 93263 TaxID=2906648 RepID=UPI002379617C|nr:abortive infection system antitoxin AbiGi family protein [Chelativorans sp. YIM 93263]
MALVGTIDPSWKDMSKYVVHFAKENPPRSAYDNAISILYERRIIAKNAFGAGRHLAPARKSVCFSEVPLHHLKRLADVRGQHGIGFRKEYVVERGGGPILYAYKDTIQAKAVNAMVHAAVNEPSSPIWDVAPFVDLPGTYGKSKYLYEWEREWRHVGNLHFAETDPAFLIIPEDLDDIARGFFASAKLEHVGPSYECPFIDPYWGEDKIEAALYP